MKEIRDIKLDLLMGNDNPIVNLFNEITDGLQIINCDVYNKDGLEFIYFAPTKSNKENEWIFYQDAKNGEFWCVYNRYWKIFESEFNFKYEEIQAITKYLVEEALKREVDTPRYASILKPSMVEEALKREVTIPYFLRSRLHTSVEEALKREIAKPGSAGEFYKGSVDEALKREVSTPYTNDILLNLVPVEEALKKTLDKK